MLNFVNHYYEVTEENIDQLRHLIELEDIRDYGSEKLDLDSVVRIGYVLGNIANNNPKQTGVWTSNSKMSKSGLKKVTTQLPKIIMTIE